MRPYRACAPMLALFAVLAVVAAIAQEDTDTLGDYDALRLDRVGRYEGFLDFRIESFSEGVDITLLSEDPAKKPLPISADRMTFTWPEGKARPSRIELEGKVIIEHPQAAVRAEAADWDFEKGLLVFTGDPILRGEDGQQIQAEKVVLNFREDRLTMYGARADKLYIGAASGAAAKSRAALLDAGDILDWPGFLNTIKAQGAAAEASPGKQIATLLDAEARGFITTLPPATLLEHTDKLLQQINRVMTSPDLYDAAAWKGIALDAPTRALLEQDALSAADQARLNRALLEAAYPDVIQKRPGTRGQAETE